VDGPTHSAALSCGAMPMTPASPHPAPRTLRVSPAPTAAAARAATLWTRTALTLLATLALGLALSSATAQELREVASGLDRPLGVAHAGDGSGRLFVVEQRGTVQVLVQGAVQADPYVDLRDRTRAQGERGLLGLAFHPRFSENARLFVHYTDLGGTTTLSELRAASADAATVDVATERVILTQEQPYGNHNGGQIAFGPDGFLYVALGDGGSGGDPLDAGQDLGTWLGAILRIDVDGDAPYAVPADNPFVDVAGARPEIWAYGLRNPWRFSFDAETGDLWIADVGQSAVEEVNLQRADSPGGENYGWRIMEGDRCHTPARGCDPTGLVMPVITYTHASGWGRSITGGYVARGDDVPSLRGTYVFGDFVSGRVFAAERSGDSWEARPLLDTGFNIAAFGQGEDGALYLADYGSGRLFRFVE
jgi:glucose/arabinose dehydrogenase